MRLLLDHCVDRRFAGHLAGHDVRTAAEMNWDQLKNGKLLSAAAEAGFEALLTTDRNLKYQQNLQRLPIAVVVLVAKTNRLADLVELVPLVERALKNVAPRTLVEVEATELGA